MQFSVEHIGLAAEDPTLIKDWCVNVLGAELVYSDGQTPPAYFVEWPGGGLVEIYASHAKMEGSGDNRVAGWRHLALRVPSIERACEALRQRGVMLESQVKPAGGGGRVLFFQDPEGNLWHLVERPEHSPFSRPAG